MLKSKKLTLRGRRRKKTRHRAACKDSRKRHLVSRCELQALNRVPSQGIIWVAGIKEKQDGKKKKKKSKLLAKQKKLKQKREMGWCGERIWENVTKTLGHKTEGIGRDNHPEKRPSAKSSGWPYTMSHLYLPKAWIILKVSSISPSGGETASNHPEVPQPTWTKAHKWQIRPYNSSQINLIWTQDSVMISVWLYVQYIS